MRLGGALDAIIGLEVREPPAVKRVARREGCEDHAADGGIEEEDEHESSFYD